MLQPLLARTASLILLLIALPAMSDNPLLEKNQFPNFSAIKANDFAPAMTTVLQAYNNTLNQVSKATPSWNNTVQPLEEATNDVTRVWNLISFLHAVNNTNEIEKAYTELLPSVTGFYTNVVRNADLYKAYSTIRTNPDFIQLTADQQNAIERMLIAFKLGGAELTADQQAKYNQIVLKLNQSEQQFNTNLQNSIKSWQYVISPENSKQLDGLPDDVKDFAAKKAKSLGKTGWVITLDDFMVNAVCSYAQDRDLRKIVYTAYITRASDQDPEIKNKIWNNANVITEILKLRQQLANLVGFNSYAEYVFADKQISSITNVMNLLTTLAIKIKPAAQTELNKLQDYAALHDKITQLEMWDIAYYAEMYKNDHYHITQSETRNYFPEDTVFNGLSNIVSLIYGLNVQRVANPNVWHDSVKLYAIKDNKNNTYGYFYTDLYARANKQPSAWMTECLARLKFSDGKMQLPIGIITTNFTPGNPGLLSHEDVMTLFHEYGNMLAHVLANNNYPSTSGINGAEFDAAALAGQFMQNWGWQYQVIQDISQNISTGNDLPKNMLDTLHARYTFAAAINLLRQVEMSIFDLQININDPENRDKSVLDILNAIRKQYSIAPYTKEDRLANRFTHIFADGYASSYFEFVYTDIMASDAYAAFSDSGFFNYVTGSKFLSTVIAQGGTKSAIDLFTQFRGRAPSIQPYLKQNGIS